MLMLIYVDWLACPYKLGGLHFLMEIVIGAMKTSRRLSVSGISCIVCRGNLMFAIPGTKWCSLPSRAILAILWPGKNTELVGLQRYTKYTSYDAQYAKSCHVIGFWSILQAFVELALAWTSCSPWLAIMHCEFLPIIWQIRIGMLYVYVCFIFLLQSCSWQRWRSGSWGQGCYLTASLLQCPLCRRADGRQMATSHSLETCTRPAQLENQEPRGPGGQSHLITALKWWVL